MSDQETPEVEGFGEYHPQAASHPAFNDAMAAWHNQVRSMRRSGELPTVQAPQDEPERAAELAQEPQGTQETGVVEQGPDGDSATVQPTTGDSGSGDEPREVFDPAEHNAPEVLGYLRGVGEDEALRVLESEETGKARKGILNLKDDVLAKARENDETGSGSKDA